MPKRRRKFLIGASLILLILSRFAPAKPDASPQTRGRIPILPRTPIGQTSPRFAEMLHSKNLTRNSFGESLITRGQWIWTVQDKKIFLQSRHEIADLKAALWPATVTASPSHWGEAAVSYRLNLSPLLLKDPRAAILIRVEDDVHPLWDKDFEKTVASFITALQGIKQHVSDAGANPSEYQIDYDCPVRLLSKWADVMRRAKEKVFHENPLWITSLVVHVRSADYGKNFRGAIDGHIVQVFDTGNVYREEEATALDRQLAQQALPFKIGLGGFERSGSVIKHAPWFKALSLFEKNPLYRGFWVFPAGYVWTPLLDLSKNSP